MKDIGHGSESEHTDTTPVVDCMNNVSYYNCIISHSCDYKTYIVGVLGSFYIYNIQRIYFL